MDVAGPVVCRPDIAVLLVKIIKTIHAAQLHPLVIHELIIQAYQGNGLDLEAQTSDKPPGGGQLVVIITTGRVILIDGIALLIRCIKSRFDGGEVGIVQTVYTRKMNSSTDPQGGDGTYDHPQGAAERTSVSTQIVSEIKIIQVKNGIVHIIFRMDHGALVTQVADREGTAHIQLITVIGGKGKDILIGRAAGVQGPALQLPVSGVGQVPVPGENGFIIQRVAAHRIDQPGVVCQQIVVGIQFVGIIAVRPVGKIIQHGTVIVDATDIQGTPVIRAPGIGKAEIEIHPSCGAARIDGKDTAGVAHGKMVVRIIIIHPQVGGRGLVMHVGRGKHHHTFSEHRQPCRVDMQGVEVAPQGPESASHAHGPPRGSRIEELRIPQSVLFVLGRQERKRCEQYCRCDENISSHFFEFYSELIRLATPETMHSPPACTAQRLIRMNTGTLIRCYRLLPPEEREEEELLREGEYDDEEEGE